MSEQTEGVARELTLGERRVHLNFNPSNDDKIGMFKKKVAECIDMMNDNLIESSDPEAKRVFATAMTELESACHWGVKGLAKGLK
jgi:hypothetical protein